MKLTKAEKARLKLAQTQEKTRKSKINTEYYKAASKEQKAKTRLQKSKKRKTAGKGISLSQFIKK